MDCEKILFTLFVPDGEVTQSVQSGETRNPGDLWLGGGIGYFHKNWFDLLVERSKRAESNLQQNILMIKKIKQKKS